MIWNPWHGCVKYSEGCANCYMFWLDRARSGHDGSELYRTADYDCPVRLGRDGNYILPPGSFVMACMTSDFFLEGADDWRSGAWDMIRERSDVVFHLLTKRIYRVERCLPPDWGGGWDNVILAATTENQRRADERLPLLLGLPFKHKRIIAAPLLERIELGDYLDSGLIERVSCGGENYGGARICDYDWVKSLRGQCESRNISFDFFETGTNFVKDGHLYRLPDKRLQKEMADKSGISFSGRHIGFTLRDRLGLSVEFNGG